MEADEFGMQSFFCGRCCVRDWCGCDSMCDCRTALQAKGYAVPPDAPSAFAAQGQRLWPAVLEGWRTATAPGWRATGGGELEVKESTLAGAGSGLFASKTLPKGAVLPPYQGALLSPGEVRGRMRSPAMSYVWCPAASARKFQNISSEGFARDGQGQEQTYCVDARLAAEGNLARYVNAAKDKAQCGAVNVELCELGQVMYMRTTRPVQAGEELVTTYGAVYWKGFRGC